MVSYETLILVCSEATNDELAKLEKSVDSLVADAKGTVNIFDRWGKCRLAYPVQKNDYGIYVLTRYDLPSPNLNSFFKQLHSLFKIKLNEVVLRYVNIILKKDAPADYARPNSIQGPRPGGNLDAFLKENKMEGFLSEGKDSTNTSKDTQEVKDVLKVEVPEQIIEKTEDKGAEEISVDQKPQGDEPVQR